MTDKNLGHATAYGYAKSKGYTGTEEEFAELMASYADVAESAKGYAEQAEASATNAETSASNAQASATSAGTSASSASASAQTASTKASEASNSATSASESASTAVSAKDDAVAAKEEAETAKADAETAAEEAQESAQTVANKADKDGTYPDMTVGGVMSSDGSTDSTPYLYRESGGGVEVGTVEEDSIVGGTVAWNQLLDNVSSFTVNSGEDKSNIVKTVLTFMSGHKYLVSCVQSVAMTSNTRNSFVYNDGSGHTIANIPNYHLSAGLQAQLFSPSTSTNNGFLTYWCHTPSVNVTFSDFNLFDLTQMFGSTVADYIYSLEQSSTGAGVAFFRKLFPKDYYEYNTGELMSVEGVSAHVMRDADDNIIGSYPLDSSLTLRGIPKVADGKLYYDGDTYESDGTVTRKYGVITFDGSETWSFVVWDKKYRAYISVPDINTAIGSDAVANVICNNFVSDVYGGRTKSAINFVTGRDGVAQINFFTNYATTLGDWKTWVSDHPITVVYELATPTTESAQPYESIQKVSKYGTEEYVSTGIVPVGHVTKYPTDIVSKVDGLPSDFSTLIAPTETGFKATKAYSVNQFLIVNNQLYRVTASIANGATITVGTNVVATTIAEILTSLLNA